MKITPKEQDFLDRNQLPVAYLEAAQQWFSPLIVNFIDNFSPKTPPKIIGINGCQGSGKSTLADYLCTVIAEHIGITAVSLSLDDFYLTKAERNSLAKTTHPLLATRGVPGTHDIELAKECINSLKEGKKTLITRFDKSIDDRAPRNSLETINEPVGLIVLEGWCLGATPEAEARLAEPINSLEEIEDNKAIWRHYVNQAIAGEYQSLFSMVDELVMLQAPSFDRVYHWRLEQEQKLKQRLITEGLNQRSGVMTEQQICRFISYFQRVTENILTELPSRTDHLFKLGEAREIIHYTGLLKV